MFDMAAPGFLIGQAIGRWGNFFNQEAFGGNTTLPWGMTGDIIKQNPNHLAYDSTLPVHPTFLYESLWCLLGLLLIHIVSKKAYKFKGQLFCMYVMWYGAGRFFIELLRTDSLMAGTVPISCIVAAVSVVGGAVAFFVLRSLQARKTMEAALANGAPAEELPLAEELPESPAEEPTEPEEEQDGEEN
jgi:phosphatidylglycerol:prolipoprotein diacylglycerol transferase